MDIEKGLDGRFKSIISLVKPYWPRIVLAVVLSMVVSSINGALAWLVKPAMNGIFIDKNKEYLLLIPLSVFLLYIVRGVFNFSHSYLMTSVGAKLVRDMRNRLYTHITFLPLSKYNERSTGLMLSRIINDTGYLQKVVAHSVKDLFVEGATVVALSVVAFIRRWDLTLLSLMVLPFAFYGVSRLGKRLKKVTKEAQRKISIITELLTETFSGIKIIKVFGKESALINRFKKRNQDFYRENMRSTRIVEATSLLMEFVGGLGITFVIWYGGRLVVSGAITPGDFFSFLAAIFMIYTPAKRLAKVHNGLQQARASIDRINEFLILEREKDGNEEIDGFNHSIEYRDVSFRYPTSETYALRHINLKIKKGDIIALVGRSGAGKTTFVDLLPRFYDPSEGDIFIDNINIKDLKISSLRALIGVVSQDIILFNDTVRANIAFGRPDATEEEIREAAKAAYAHDFIMELPQGYDTMIGERGVRLSGGQRQRLSIARAILKNPPILILDEATSSLDTHAEMMVQKALDSLMKNRTTIVIAHRLSTVRIASKIIVLDHGMIIEQGTHDELLKLNGVYKHLHEIQFPTEREILFDIK
jgi:subfamily B ATP-binding cassette protein MsbA